MHAGETTDPRHARAAWRMSLEALVAEVVTAMRADCIETVVLKGPGLARLLYDDPRERSYRDVDLLVAPGDIPRAASVLRREGFEQVFDEAAQAGLVVEAHAQLWRRPANARALDLHWRVVGIATEPVEAWPILRERTRPISLGKTTILVPDDPTAALLLALHAAFHGAQRGPWHADIRLAVDRLGAETWGEAATLARRLGCAALMGAGLALVTGGPELARSLGLPGEPPLEAALAAGAPPPGAFAVARVSTARGPRAKLQVVRSVLFPAPAWMRLYHASARRGRLGLLAAYAARFPRLRHIAAARREVRARTRS